MRAPELDHGGDLFFRDERRVQAMHARRSRRQVEHVAASQQRFGAIGVENGARVDLGRHAERNAGREVGLDQAGDDVDRRPLRRQHQVNADGARHLRQARDRFFDVARVEHHQVGQLVDDDDDVGQRPVFGIFAEQAAACRRRRTACCTARCCARPFRPAASGGAPSRARHCAAHWRPAWAR